MMYDAYEEESNAKDDGDEKHDENNEHDDTRWSFCYYYICYYLL